MLPARMAKRQWTAPGTRLNLPKKMSACKTKRKETSLLVIFIPDMKCTLSNNNIYV